jgi:hypothetical protein
MLLDLFRHSIVVGALKCGGLRSAQQQNAHHRYFSTGEVEHFLHVVLILGDAAFGAPGSPGQPVVFQSVECLPDLVLVEVGDRLAVILLVAGVGQCVHREWIVLRRGNFFFYQRSKHASGNRGEFDRHGNDSTLM